MVLGLGKGHSDAQAFVPKELPEPSLPPSSGCAVNASHGRQPKAVFVQDTTKERALLRENGLGGGGVVVVVVVVVWLWLFLWF